MLKPQKGKSLYWILSIAIDLVIILSCYTIVLSIFPLTNNDPFEKYNSLLVYFVVIWLSMGVVLWKYSASMMGIKCLFSRILYSDILAVFVSIIVLQLYSVKGGSINVLYSLSIIILLLELTVYALVYNFRSVKSEKDDVPNLQNQDVTLAMCIPAKQLAFVKKYVDENTLTNFGKKATVSELMKMDLKTCFVHELRFNKIEEPNLFLAIANEKLTDKGYYIGVFETKNARKQRLLSALPWGLNYLYYIYDVLYKRFLPNFYLTATFFQQLYTKIDRVYSKTEVYGRLYCAGFEFVDDFKTEGNTFFIFQKTGKPQRYKELLYSPLIGLERIGKNGRVFTEYKFRTMYPYSEYLQSFMIKKNQLREGGKINRDVRITRIGAFCRRVWLDELPQLINLLKGDIKLVGVRPLSKQYFSLYSSELQNLRTKFKPGMLPPYYADMPKTLDEIQASEMKYLKNCQTKGVFVTDVRYLFLIFNNIVIKRARSH